MRVTKLRLVGMERERDYEEPPVEMECEWQDSQLADALVAFAMMVAFMLMAGICGGIELGTIPFPL